MPEPGSYLPIEVDKNGPPCKAGYICIMTGFCYISQQLIQQARSGGQPSPTQIEGTGPYWKEKGWNSYNNNVRKMANSCLTQKALEELAKRITADKKSRGELF